MREYYFYPCSSHLRLISKHKLRDTTCIDLPRRQTYSYPMIPRAKAHTLILAALLSLALIPAAASSEGSGAAPELERRLSALRDAVYDSASPAEIEAAADAARAMLPSDGERDLFLSRIEYFLARSRNENGEKKKAAQGFETAVAAADRYLDGLQTRNAKVGDAAEETAGLLAKAKALSELVILKDVVFLIANGPKVPALAKRILELEPGNVGARLIVASSKAYPPAVFGGDPKEALRLARELMELHPQGLAKDELFDLRACFATAYEKLQDKANAAAWFAAALELYPRNRYALDQMGKLKK